jgi:hypothetical protein
MTKKDYIVIASVMKAELIAHPESKPAIMHIVDNLSLVLKNDNPAFNYSRFLNACTDE